MPGRLRVTCAPMSKRAMAILGLMLLFLLLLLNKEQVQSSVLEYKQWFFDRMDKAKAFAKDAGYRNVFGLQLPVAPFFIVFMYAFCCVILLPLLGFHSISGMLYGTFYGSLLVSFAQCVGAACVFYLARFVARPWISRYLQRKFGKKYEAIDAAVSSDGFKIVFLMRLSPVIPFSITNYVAGCSDVSIWRFIAGTWLGIIPGTTLYVSIGAIVEAARGSNEQANEWETPVKPVLVGCGLLATVKLLHMGAQKANEVLAEVGFTGSKED